MKAVDPEPSQRYPTVEAFCADLQRYLAAEPVPATRGYRLRRHRRWLMKHRAMAFAVLLAIAATTTVWVGLWWGMVHAQADAGRGWDAHANARRATRFLEETLLDATGESFDPQQAHQRVIAELSAHPEAEALVRIALGRIASNSGNLALARLHFERVETLAAGDAALGQRERARVQELLAGVRALEAR